MSERAKMLRNLLLIVAIVAAALLYSFMVAGCREQSTDPQDYFIREFEVRDGQTFTFYKTGKKEFQVTYDGFNAVGWARYYWPGFEGFKNTQLIAPWVEDKRFQMIYPDVTTFEVYVIEQTPSKAILRLFIVINGVVQ